MTFGKLVEIMETSLEDEKEIGFLPSSLRKKIVFNKREKICAELLIRHFAYYIDLELIREELSFSEK